MYMGIGEKQLEIIDNEQNREIVRNFIINDYKSKYFEDEIDGEVWNRMINILKCALSVKKLHELLVLDGDDADAIIWRKMFDDLKFYVNENTFGAKRFFKVGGDAQLNEDEYWDEYNIMLGLIPEKTSEFVAAFSHRNEWQKLINNVAGYIKAVIPTKCKWVAFSNDGAYEDFSREVFDDKKSCYENMRQAVLEKMKWNTEFDEDFTESDDAVGYKVRFTQDEIIHCSFSGVYVYRIIGEGETLTKDEIFTADFNEWLKKMGFDYV